MPSGQSVHHKCRYGAGRKASVQHASYFCHSYAGPQKGNRQYRRSHIGLPAMADPNGIETQTLRDCRNFLAVVAPYIAHRRSKFELSRISHWISHWISLGCTPAMHGLLSGMSPTEVGKAALYFE